MTGSVRAVTLAVLAVVGAAAILVSRHTPAATVATAAGQQRRTVVSASALPILAAGPAPAVDGNTGWLNTPDGTAPNLAGKVVLYDFWTFGCSNCRNTLPHVKSWQARYAADGLVILSIHSPEFDYEADAANVADYVSTQGIEYPVALDADHAVWNAWGNHYWPAFYLYDSCGRLRAQHFGEGAYDSTEDAIRALLAVDPSSPRAEV